MVESDSISENAGFNLTLSEKSLEEVKSRIVEFIRKSVENSKTGGVVLGVSGGVDSATVAFLCSYAVGSDRVFALIMPEKGVTEERDVEHAIRVCEITGIDYKIVDISKAVEEFKSMFDCYDDLAIANLKPRIRMIINYYHANCLNRIVVGTGNKSELMVGYFTKYGDGGCDILPIGDLYKTEVFQLARYLGVPEEIISKKPSAGLWKGQTDEGEMGVSYRDLDKILLAIELGMESEEIVGRLNLSEKTVRNVFEMVERSEHKRMMPSIPSLRDLVSYGKV
jgi:NAD+ synthase